MVYRYKLKNLCCRGCAAQMEQTIGVLPGVTGASIDFEGSLLTIHGEEVDMDMLREIIQKIEPQVEVVEVSISEKASTLEKEKGFISSLLSRENLPEIRKLIFASLLFAGGMLFEDPLRSTPWFFGYYGVFLAAYLICGLDVIKSAFRNLAGGNLFDEFFLMTLATFAAIALGFMGEAVGVMLFYSIGEFFQDLAASNSRNSIKSLLASRPTSAHLLQDGELRTILPEDAVVGDVLMVRPGEKIPLDGMVLTGSSQVDTSPLTGEPVPISVEVGEPLYGGSINLSGVLTIRVTSAYKETAIARILELVEFAVAQKSPTERFITKFARYYTPAVVILALFVAFLPPLLGMGSFSSWIYKALVLLIISCPCALMVSIPLGYFGGIGAASKHGLLVKGGNVLDALNEVTTVIFDKTGTLTKGVFEVTSLRPVTGITPEDLLRTAALAEMNSNHPIARSIMKAFGKMPEKIDVEMKEIPGKGVEAVHEGRTILAGTSSLLEGMGIFTRAVGDSGTVVHLALDGKYQGYLVVSDVVKDDSSLAVKKLKKLGVRTVSMLTGDRYGVASSVSSSLGLDSFKAELLPHQKVDQVRSLKEKAGGGVIFAGDGINDAPSLATADVGIAMGGLGSEAAIETADLVILSDRPSEVADAISLARQTRKIVWQNIILALGVKAAVLLLGVAGISGLWEAVFADVGVALLAVLNSARTVRMSVVTQS